MHRHIAALFTITATALVALQDHAHADEDALYGAAIPADAIFIRPLSSLPDTSLFGRDFSAGELEPLVYTAISAASLNGVVPGSYYSVTRDVGGVPEVIREPDRDDLSRVHLILLNAADTDASLLIDHSGDTVIDRVESRAASARAVNPVSVALRVETGDGSKTFDLSLRRGQNVSFVVTDTDITLLPSTFGPVIEGE